jgi:uncharacterized protein
MFDVSSVPNSVRPVAKSSSAPSACSAVNHRSQERLPRIAHNVAMRIEADGRDVLIWIKAVPGASRDEVAGIVGDRLKVRISAPPEGGKANKAIIKLLARKLKLKPAQITIESGQTNPEKTVRLSGCTAGEVGRLLAE